MRDLRECLRNNLTKGEREKEEGEDGRTEESGTDRVAAKKLSIYRELLAALLTGVCYLPSDHRAKFHGGSSRVPATRLLAFLARRNYQKSSKKTEKPSAAMPVFLQFWRGAIDTRWN